MKRNLLLSAAAAVALAFLVFVWPTPYRYFKTPAPLVRVNRVTGSAAWLDLANGWTACRPAKLDIFGDVRAAADSVALLGLSDPREFAPPPASEEAARAAFTAESLKWRQSHPVTETQR